MSRRNYTFQVTRTPDGKIASVTVSPGGKKFFGPTALAAAQHWADENPLMPTEIVVETVEQSAVEPIEEDNGMPLPEDRQSSKRHGRAV